MWKEIRISHLDETDGFWRVDAWKTEDDNEEGEVIAYIDDLTGRVLYNDPVARVDAQAQELIQEHIKKIETGVKLTRNSIGSVSVSMKTDIGTLVAEFEPDKFSGSGYDAILTGITLKDREYLDLSTVKADGREVRLYQWSDPYDEDWQIRNTIPKEDLLEAVSA